MGAVSEKYLGNYMGTYINIDSAFGGIINVFIFILVFSIGYLLHIIIHEAGHLIFGLMTGYSFISFRVGSITLVKEDEKLHVKRFNVPGTAGQCLMMPPEIEDGKYPLMAYNLGGAIMNLVLAIISISIAILAKGVKFPWDGILFVSGSVGMLTGLLNGIPLRIGGISNDGHNVLSMLKDQNARDSFHLILKVNGLLSQGMRIKDMPLDIFKLEEGADLSSPLNTAVGLMEYNWYLDNMDLDGARRSIDSFQPYLDKLITLYRNEINCERLFLELTGDCDRDFIDKIYDKDLKNYVKQAKYMLGKKRFLMAYEGFYNRKRDKASQYYADLKKLAEKYPVKGEADMEVMLGDWVYNRLQDLAI